MVLLLPAIFKKLIFITQRVSSLKNWLRKLIKKLMKLKKLKMVLIASQNFVIIAELEVMIILINTQT